MEAQVTLHLFDSFTGRHRHLCINCLETWLTNGFPMPSALDIDNAGVSAEPCEECLREEAVARDAADEVDLG